MTMTFARPPRFDQGHWDHLAIEAVTDHGALQDPWELGQLLALLDQARPRRIVEVGADRGGTLWAWSRIPGPPQVVAVSLPGGPYSTTGEAPQLHGAQLVEGDSADAETYRRACEALDYQRADFCMIDADHTFRGVAADWLQWRALVRPGGLLAFHDITPHARSREVEVWRFWRLVRTFYPGSIEIRRPGLDWAGIGLVQV